LLSGFVTRQHRSCHVTFPQLLPDPGTRLPDEPFFNILSINQSAKMVSMFAD